MNENVQKLQSLYEAFGRGDIETIVNNVTEDVTWGTPTVAQEIPWYPIRRGPAGVGDFFATLAREVEFTQFQPRFFMGADDDVVVCVDLAYRLRKNGHAASTTSVHLFKVRDGKVSSFRAHEDTAAVRDAWKG